jgi:hypothetical protein
MQSDSHTIFQQGTGLLDLKGADLILKAAGRDPARSEIDKIAMLRGINLCYHWHSEARFFSTNRGQNDRQQYLERIYKKAKALDVLLSKNSIWLPLGASPSLSRRYRAPIREIISNIDRELRETNGAIKVTRTASKRAAPSSG